MKNQASFKQDYQARTNNYLQNFPNFFKKNNNKNLMNKTKPKYKNLKLIKVVYI